MTKRRDDARYWARKYSEMAGVFLRMEEECIRIAHELPHRNSYRRRRWPLHKRGVRR